MSAEKVRFFNLGNPLTEWVFEWITKGNGLDVKGLLAKANERLVSGLDPSEDASKYSCEEELVEVLSDELSEAIETAGGIADTDNVFFDGSPESLLHFLAGTSFEAINLKALAGAILLHQENSPDEPKAAVA